jgi:hypothetical protein
MRLSRVFGCVALLALTGISVMAQQGLKSGPQVGEEVPGPYHPLNVTGPYAGKKQCLFCKHGASPVAVVFARELTPEVTDLLKKLDDATAKNKDAKMGSYAVFCNDDEKLQGNLKDVAEKQKLTSLPLTVDNASGPADYSIAKDADVTVILYREFTVKSNYAFRKGELKDADVSKIVADVSKIVSK